MVEAAAVLAGRANAVLAAADDDDVVAAVSFVA